MGHLFQLRSRFVCFTGEVRLSCLNSTATEISCSGTTSSGYGFRHRRTIRIQLGHSLPCSRSRRYARRVHASRARGQVSATSHGIVHAQARAYFLKTGSVLFTFRRTGRGTRRFFRSDIQFRIDHHSVVLSVRLGSGNFLYAEFYGSTSHQNGPVTIHRKRSKHRLRSGKGKAALRPSDEAVLHSPDEVADTESGSRESFRKRRDVVGFTHAPSGRSGCSGIVLSRGARQA